MLTHSDCLPLPCRNGLFLPLALRHCHVRSQLLYNSSSFLCCSQIMFKFCWGSRSPPNAPREPAAGAASRQAWPALGHDGRRPPITNSACAASLSDATSFAGRGECSKGVALGTGFDHVLHLHNSFMADALSKYEWGMGKDVQLPQPSIDNNSPQLIDIDVRQVLYPLWSCLYH